MNTMAVIAMILAANLNLVRGHVNISDKTTLISSPMDAKRETW